MQNSIPILQLRNNGVVVYDEPIYSRRFVNNHLNRKRMKQAAKTRYSGKMSPGARKRLSRAVTLVCQGIKPKWVHNPVTGRYQYHRLSFATLTVTDRNNQTHRYIYDNVFVHFLAWLRRTKDVHTIIWKAEFQNRGQIHYHLIFPDFIHYAEIRDKWNDLQHAAGLLDEYAKEHGHFKPNSTDIHEIKFVRNLANYILKELGKSMQNEKSVNGKIWDCSDNLAGKQYFAVALSSEVYEQLHLLARRKGVTMIKENFWFLLDYGNVPGLSPPDLLSKDERDQFENYLQSIFDPHYVQPEAVPVIAEKLVDNINDSSQWQPVQIAIDFN